MNSDSLVINTTNLSKSYDDVHALKALELKVPKHSIFGFLGPNGAGKTTTIKLLLGLSRPSEGKATIFGGDIVRDSVDIRKRVGYLAQEPRFYDRMTARETMRYTARFFYSGPKEAIEARIAETLELVGLGDKADRSIKGFSGGERQRLGIAQAQVNYPDLLILDEPAASLDPMGRRDVLEVMERLRKHATIFYSTHILDDVQRVSDQVAILNCGQLVAQAPIDELLAGRDGTVYTITIKGDPGTALSKLSDKEWVTAIESIPDDGQATWQVKVTDELAAETELLPIFVCDDHCLVTQFGRKRYELEEIFLNIVEGESSPK